MHNMDVKKHQRSVDELLVLCSSVKTKNKLNEAQESSALFFEWSTLSIQKKKIF